LPIIELAKDCLQWGYISPLGTDEFIATDHLTVFLQFWNLDVALAKRVVKKFNRTDSTALGSHMRGPCINLQPEREAPSTFKCSTTENAQRENIYSDRITGNRLEHEYSNEQFYLLLCTSFLFFGKLYCRDKHTNKETTKIYGVFGNRVFGGV